MQTGRDREGALGPVLGECKQQHVSLGQGWFSSKGAFAWVSWHPPV